MLVKRRKKRQIHEDTSISLGNFVSLAVVVSFRGISAVRREAQRGITEMFVPAATDSIGFDAALKEVFVGESQSHEGVTRPSSRKCYSHCARNAEYSDNCS